MDNINAISWERLKQLQSEIDQLDQLMRDNILSDDQQQHGNWYRKKCELEKDLATIIRGL